MPTYERRRFSNLAICLSVLSLFASTASAASAVLGIDLGTEYIKAALVKPSIPLEIVLTKDSKRKEYAALAFKPVRSKSSAPNPAILPERIYGGDALALSARFPGDVYSNLKPLLGLMYRDNEIITEYKSRHPGLRLVETKERGTVSFTSESLDKTEAPFLVEELLAMELKNIKGNAEAFAGKGSTIRDVVITIPAFYTAEERRAVELAADLAELRVIALVTDGLAVGLNYATSRTFDEGKPEYHLVFDMGAGSTTATVLRFQGKTVKDVGKFNKTVQEVQVMGNGWDRTLGGDAFNALILDDMLDKFAETKRIKGEGTSTKQIREHGRTMAKLWKEAERLRQVLSANTETSSSFEGLYYDDVNFKYKLSRTDFENMITQHAERIQNPIKQALDSAKLEIADLESIILHGGAVRTPYVQKQLESAVGSAEKIRTNVNSDEAAVFGAAFKAAEISPSFRVKEIRASDIAGYAVGVSWASDGKERDQKLFLSSSQVGKEKQVPFKVMEDFTFELTQEVPESAPKSPVIQIQTQNLTLSVKELTDKYGCLPTDINTKFSMRLNHTNGLPEVTLGFVSCEVIGSDKKGGVVDDVKGFFGFGSRKGEQSPLQDEVSDKAFDVETDSYTTSSPAESKISETLTTSTKSELTLKEPVKRTEVVHVSFLAIPIGLPQINAVEIRRMKDRLASFDTSDRSRLLREEALNTLEAYTYKARDLLIDEDFVAASTENQRAEIEKQFISASEWLYGDGADATRDTLKARLKELRDLVDPVQIRKEETKKRPKEIKSLQEALDLTQNLVKMMKDQSAKASEAAAMASSISSSQTTSTSTKTTQADDFADLEDETFTTSISEATKVPDAPMYSTEDLLELEKTYDTVQEWLESKLGKQEKLSPSDDPVILSTDLAAKSKELNRVTMQLLQKKMKPDPKLKSSGKAKMSKTKSPKKSKSSKSPSSKSTSKDPGVSDTSTEEAKADTTGVKKGFHNEL